MFLFLAPFRLCSNSLSDGMQLHWNDFYVIKYFSNRECKCTARKRSQPQAGRIFYGIFRRGFLYGSIFGDSNQSAMKYTAYGKPYILCGLGLQGCLGSFCPADSIILKSLWPSDKPTEGIIFVRFFLSIAGGSLFFSDFYIK